MRVQERGGYARITLRFYQFSLRSHTFNMGARILGLVLCLGYASAQALVDDFQCPDEFAGFYPHLISCDKYWKCEEGRAELKTCGNGLGFIDTDPTFTLEQCAEIHLVECGERKELEPPISTPNCPRLYGTFPDPESCSVFWKCLDGKANRYECPPGLAYDQYDRGCKWADQVAECKNVIVAVEGQEEEFKCPTGGPVGAFTKHAHPADCRQYFVCIGGVPREYGCPLGTVFSIGGDEYSGKCSDPEEVEECKNYYGDLEFDSIALSRAGADTGPLPDRVRSGSSGIRNSINRDPVEQTKLPERNEIKRRPAPPSLQSIVSEVKEEENVEEPARTPFRPRPRPSRPRPSFSQEESREPTLPEREPETPRPSRLEIITDRPRTTFPRRQETTVPETARPFTAVFASTSAPEQTVAPETTTTQAPPPSIVKDFIAPGQGLPDPVQAQPGPNGEDYYYYYYYYDEDEEAPSQQ